MTTFSKDTEIGTITKGDRKLVVMLHQQVTQTVSFAYDHRGQPYGDTTTPLQPMGLKEVRQLRKLLGQAENKMRKLNEQVKRDRRPKRKP